MTGAAAYADDGDAETGGGTQSQATVDLTPIKDNTLYQTGASNGAGSYVFAGSTKNGSLECCSAILPDQRKWQPSEGARCRLLAEHLRCERTRRILAAYRREGAAPGTPPHAGATPEPLRSDVLKPLPR